MTPYAGDYDYYLDKSRASSARAALTNAQPVDGAGIANPGRNGDDSGKAGSADADSKKPGLREAREERRMAAEQRKAEAKIKRDHEKKVRDVEMQILKLEGRQKELADELEKPETYERGGAATQLNRELLAITGDLERLTAEWERLGDRQATEVTKA